MKVLRSPTFLDLDKAYPNQPFTIVIFIEKRDTFGGAPEVLFLHAPVCIKGLIESYPGRPQIVSSGNDIKIYN